MIAIVVLTWNRRDLTLTCLQSLAALEAPGADLRLLVVDNASTDGTAEAVCAAFPQTLLLRNPENLGYAGGNNVGIRRALDLGADYVFLLNNDVVAAPDLLRPMLRAAREAPNVGVLTPLVAELDNRQRVWALGSSIDWRTGLVRRLHSGATVAAWKGAAPFDVEIAAGSAILAARSVFQTVGLLDEAFYLYFEETDWCLRARRAGYRILAVPSAVVWHQVSGTLGQASPVTDYYMLRNHLYFIRRHWSGAGRLRALAHTLGRNLLAIVAYTLKPHSGQRRPHRNARLLALRDAALGRWGAMGPDVAAACGVGVRR